MQPTTPGTSATSVRRAAAQVGTAAIVVAVVGYVAQFLAARWLGPPDYARFAVFWAILFVVVGCLSGVAQEVIRVSRVAKLRMDQGLPPEPDGPATPRIASVAIAIGAVSAAAVGLTGLAWGPPAFGPDWPWSVALLTLAGLLVSGALGLGGMVAGLARWRTYSRLVILEGLARLVLFVAAALVVPTVFGFSLAAVLAFLPGVLVLVCWPPLRRDSFAIRSDAPLRRSTTRALRAMAASGLTGVLVVGLPALLAAAAGANPRGATETTLGILILLVTLTRAPVLVPLTSFQNALIARFTGFDLHQRRRWVALGAGAIALASAVLSALAALLGPPLLPLLFGDDYQAPAGIFAALTAATAGLGFITLTGVAAITSARHSLYLTGWAVAILAAGVVLFAAPVAFEWATAIALLTGPVVGAAVHLLALRTSPAVPASPPESTPLP